MLTKISLLFSSSVLSLKLSHSQVKKRKKMWFRNLVILLTICDGILSKMQDFSELNFDDILNEKLMPAALMLIEGNKDTAWRNLSSQKLDADFECVTRGEVKKDGGFPNALNAMRYHRKMINEFLCSNFVAEKILEDIQPTLMKKRLGLAAAVAETSSEIEFEKNTSLSTHDIMRKRMLFDEGSYQYKNWLAK